MRKIHIHSKYNNSFLDTEFESLTRDRLATSTAVNNYVGNTVFSEGRLSHDSR